MCPQPPSKADLERTLREVSAGKDGNHALIKAYLQDPRSERIASSMARLSRMNRGPGLRPPSSFLATLD
jgi:hypothetical protein